MRPERVIYFPINAPGMGRFQLLNFGVLGHGLELRFWVVIGFPENNHNLNHNSNDNPKPQSQILNFP